MDFKNCPKTWEWQVVYFILICSSGWVSAQLRYSVLEETEIGMVVGNVAQDLGWNLADLTKRRLHLGSEERWRHFAVNQATGALTVRERIDREGLCEYNPSCLLHIELAAEKPLEFIIIEIEVLDINDNSPIFSSADRIVKITEVFASPGVRFPLEIAEDLDVGVNGVRQYTMNSNQYFSLSVTNRKDGTLIPELVLEKALDREEKWEHKLILTAVDGGEQPRSGSCQITVIVLDINDNAPVFDQSIYKIRLMENPYLNTVVMILNATDLDDGANGEIEYYFDDHTSKSTKELFNLNAETGEIYTKGVVDFEQANLYELSVRAKDKGVPELEGRCLIQIEVEDVNDNPPEIRFTSTSSDVPENTAIETAVAFFTVKDRDSGKNGEVKIEVLHNLPFKVKPFKNGYSLVTSGLLDKEKIAQYNIQLIATDMGSPPLSTQSTITINISDLNDNSPIFTQAVYNAFIQENNDPGISLCTVSAFDLDEGINSELVYSVVESYIDSSSISSFVYINPNSGNIYAQRSFDYEHNQVFEITIQVEDSGYPKLGSNVTVFIFVLDTNDNYPMVLYPQYSKEMSAEEVIPRAASVGHLVTKISAVDLDSGQNAWLLFSLIGSTDTTLFQVSANTGEIRTIRNLQEMDNTEQQLTIVISDHGNPSLSTTVTINLSIVDTIIQESTTSGDYLTNSKPPSDLTLYLIISLVAISLVSIVTFLILLVKCLKKETYDDNSIGCCMLSRSEPKSFTEQYKPTLYLNTDGTLKYMEVRMIPPESQGQCYQTCFHQTTETSDFIFQTPASSQLKDAVNAVDSSAATNWTNSLNQAQPNTEWRFSQAQRPGPSGAQPTEEAGVWPNNQFETERLQAMILASANEAAEGTSGLGGGTGTMGLSARYGPQFTLQHVPDYRQNVYIPGSTLTPTNGAGKREGKASGNKKKSGKKEKK
ncbi:protocadherin gamma-C5-like isoform X10 [Pelobates fuscus]|uniref:protocadherin gamma-C5-like isoform X10 n=1 Tax=Pelobates fuscus TaxID=191477 RepID=UPI002FE4D7CD